jgi:hypothetical protein
MDFNSIKMWFYRQVTLENGYIVYELDWIKVSILAVGSYLLIFKVIKKK